jgi:hypothetical protein
MEAESTSRRSLVMNATLWLAIATIGSLVGAAFVKGFAEAFLLAIAVAAGIEFFRRPAVKEWLRFLPRFPHLRLVGGAALTAAVFMLGWASGYPWVKPYPRDDGLIADFNGAFALPARTYNGNSFNIVLDSDWNKPSKVWYERIAESEPEGFLRIYYQLESVNNSPSYGGVFVDLSHLPAVPYDVSAFRGLHFRLRMGQAVQKERVSFVVPVASANINCGWNDYLEFPVAWNDLITDWKDIDVPFGKLRDPPFSIHQHHFDPHQVFRVAFIIKGAPGVSEHGFLDIDDISFQP